LKRWWLYLNEEVFILQQLKKIFTLFALVFLIIASIPLQASASNTLQTDLVNGLVTKTDRLTFDLFAKDAYGNKIEASEIEVLNNNQIVAINWDDKEKTSYTLNLEIGVNNISISHQSAKLEYQITREPANDGDVIGHFVFSLDAFTIGQGYLIEPIEVPIIKGRNAAQELDEILRDYGFTYKSTGQLDSGYYLATVYGDQLFQKPVIIPDVLKAALNGTYDETLYAHETGLGEFDINYMSGWMYSINNVFPNVGFADKYMLDGDVMRVQFTLAYGQDIGGGGAMGGDGGVDFYPKVNKDELTRKIAAINTPGKNLYLINSTRIQAYKNALQILQKVNASQSEIDAALSTLQAADQATQSDGSVYKEDEVIAPAPTPVQPSTETEARQQANRVTSQIQVLPAVHELTLADAAAVALARQNYNALSAAAQALVTNVSKLVQVEAQIKGLQDSSSLGVTPPTELPNIGSPSTNLTDVQKVMNAISTLPTTIKLTDETAILTARKAYDALASEQKLLVMNYSTLLLAEMNLATLKDENSASQAKIAQTIRLIHAIPATISLKDQVAIQEARASYNKLSAAEKGAVTNYDKLLNAETSLQAAIEKNKSVQQLQQLIDALPKNITKEQQAQLEKIIAQYEALTATQQGQITAIQRVKDALAQLTTEKENDEGFVIENDIVKISSDQKSATISNEQLQQILNNKAITSIEVTTSTGNSYTIAKHDLPSNLKDAEVTITEQLITIGANKELLIQVKVDSKALQMPVLLKLSQATFKNGYLLQKTNNQLAATPHFAQDQFVYANGFSNQAYVYTTNEVTFNDLQSDIFAEDIYYLANRYVVQGSNGNYRSNDSITRADFAVMIARAMDATPQNETKFTDIKGEYYEQAVQALNERKIINGVSDTRFNPTAELSREDAALMMARVLRHVGMKQPANYTLAYTDANKIHEDYKADIAWLQQLGIMSGSNNHFDPKGKLTRGQMAKILTRTLNIAKIM